MHLLKEHQELSLQPDFDIQEFEDYLQEIWNDRKYFYDFEDDDLTNEFSNQRFISLLRGNRIKASQHIGFLQLNDLDLIVYPKLLSNLKEEDLIVFYKHLVYWLSYCRRINFPFNNIL